MRKRQPDVRDTLRAVFDVIMLAEPAQVALWQSKRLTLTQLGAFRALADQPLTAGRLAERLAISPTSLTRVLDRLEERGLVERAKGDPDRRTVTIHLTQAGRRVLDGISVLAGTAMHEAVQAMNDAERIRLWSSVTLLTELTRQQTENREAAPRDDFTAVRVRR